MSVLKKKKKKTNEDGGLHLESENERWSGRKTWSVVARRNNFHDEWRGERKNFQMKRIFRARRCPRRGRLSKLSGKIRLISTRRLCTET